MDSKFARWFICAGGVLIAAGLVLYLIASLPEHLRPGRLPGDIRIERDNFSFYFPVTTMLLVSAVLSASLWLLRRL